MQKDTIVVTNAYSCEPHPPPYTPSAPVYPYLESRFQWLTDEPPLNFQALSEFLGSKSWTPSMIEQFRQNLRTIPMRYYVYDDSGSMCTRDGSKKGPSGHYHTCTRWEELTDSMKFQFIASNEGNIRSKFLFLNNKKIYATCEPYSNGEMLNEMLTMEGGGTPLCETINRIANDIESYKDGLIQLRKKVILFIATDGEASDGDVTVPLRRLKDLPVYLILRLCTNQERIVDYWNQIDKDLELHLDVLDDFCSESKEVHDVNPEICYSEPLHQYREFGTKTQEMDLLDETKLSYDQLNNFARMIYGQDFLDGNAATNNSIISKSYSSHIYAPFCVVTGRSRNYVTFPKTTESFVRQESRCPTTVTPIKEGTTKKKSSGCIIC